MTLRDSLFRRRWVAALLPIFFCLGCSHGIPEIDLSGPTMGTTYSVKVARPPDEVDGHTLRVAIDEVLAHIDVTMSGYRSDSEIARFNASSSTEWFDVSADVATVVQTALAVSRASGGTFDITVAPLVKAWGFGASGEPTELPDDAELAQIKQRVGYQHLQVRLDPPALRKDVPELSVDLNGIAPGFAVDLLAKRLESMGVDNFMIDIGGEIQAHGVASRGGPWRIAVERPIDKEPEPYKILQLQNAAVTTSGEYRHYYDRNGQRYSHTIDPRTGRPVQHSLASVVVAGQTSMDIDAWATAFNVLGTQEGKALAEKLGMPVMFIDAQNGQLQSVMTAQFGKFIAAE
jgi:thiamine biosynthesis lipoprotein